ncbi:MAG: hypothetical protein JO056_12525 [Alphaproteobacteria bacterium]|nr:hypothetical protein [Alphaproteobacteria bacterium]
MTEGTIVVDFVARGDSPDEWKLVLVEQGPWHSSLQANLRRIQDRLYECLDAALDGQVVQKFPESKGKKVTIRLDCYNVPKEPVAEFFDKFARGALLMPDYREALGKSPFVSEFGFEVTFDAIH